MKLLKSITSDGEHEKNVKVLACRFLLPHFSEE